MYALMCQTCGGMEETCGEMPALLRNVLHNIEQCNILGGAIENMQKKKNKAAILDVFSLPLERAGKKDTLIYHHLLDLH